VGFKGRIARVARDTASGTIRLYEWRTGDYDAVDWLAYTRHLQTGLAMRWLQARYPAHRLACVQAYLVGGRDAGTGVAPGGSAGREFVARAQAMAIADWDRAPLGRPPVSPGRN